MMEPTEEINRIKEIIVENYHPDKIVLFGSYARGDFDEQSDIDILVISLVAMLRKKVKEWRDIFGNDTIKIVEVSV